MSFDFDAVADILACPKCHGPLICTDDALICARGADHRLRFPIVDGIPRLLIEEAEELPADEWEALVAAGSGPKNPDSDDSESGP